MLFILLCLPLCGSAQAGVQLLAADHQGTWTGTGIRWESRFLLEEGAETELRLAVDLPPEVVLVELDGADPGLDALGALSTLRPWPGSHELRLVLEQPVAAGTGPLAAPVVFSDEAQRITLVGVDWEPDPALGLESRMRHTMPPTLSRAERRTLDRRLDGGHGRGRPHAYVMGDAHLARLGGLFGEVGPAGRVPVGVIGGTAVAFLGLLAAGALGHRLLEVQARRERLEAYMNDEFVQAELRRKGEGTAGSAGS